MQIASWIVLTVAAAALLEYVFSAPRGSLWLRLTPALVGLSACGLFQIVIFYFVGRDRVPAGFFNDRTGAMWWTIAFPAVCLTIAMAIHLRRVVERVPAEGPARRNAIAWSAVVWAVTTAFFAVQLVRGRSSVIL